jgi:hypothetical protein
MSAFDPLGIALTLNDFAFRDIQVCGIAIGVNGIDYEAQA